MTSNEMRERLANDRDFILCKRFNYSLEELLERYPEGAPSKVIAQALGMTEDGLEELEKNIIEKMRADLNVTVDQ